MAKFTTLNLNTLDYPFETLVQRVNADPPKLILDPDFQREYKWDKEGWVRASKFIESCLMRIPLPSCYFAENSDGHHLVIDGVQRLTTIVKFFNDEFRLEEMTAFPELEGKKFSELGSFKTDLESTTIRCILLRKDNPEELVTEIFARLNQGAVMLSDQEIRHALNPGPFDLLLQKLATEEVISSFGVGKAGKRVRNGRESEELVLRFFAFFESSIDYEGNLKKFLDAYMRKASTYDENKLNDLERAFLNSLEACKIIFDEPELFTNINSNRLRQGIVYYDLLMTSLGKIPHDVLRDKRGEVRKAFSILCNSPSFKKSLAGGLQRKSSINQRNADWSKKLAAAI